jgi:hypothetical protein
MTPQTMVRMTMTCMTHYLSKQQYPSLAATLRTSRAILEESVLTTTELRRIFFLHFHQKVRPPYSGTPVWRFMVHILACMASDVQRLIKGQCEQEHGVSTYNNAYKITQNQI